MTNKTSRRSAKPAWKKVSFWIAMAIWFLLLIPFLAMDGFGAWLVLFALFLIITALYSLILGRPSWMGLPHRNGAGGAIAGGVAALIAGVLMVPTAPMDSSAVQPFAAVEAVATTSATPSSSPTPSPTPRYALLDPCATDGKSVAEGTANYICTADDKGALVWMKEKESQALVAERAEAKKVAEGKAAAEKALVEKAAIEQAAAAEAARVASEQAAAAEASRIAAEQAAAAEAARLAAQQAAPPQAPAPAAPDAYYENCTAARAAGAAPIYLGQPGYRPKLDGNSDGVACER